MKFAYFVYLINYIFYKIPGLFTLLATIFQSHYSILCCVRTPRSDGAYSSCLLVSCSSRCWCVCKNDQNIILLGRNWTQLFAMSGKMVVRHMWKWSKLCNLNYGMLGCEIIYNFFPILNSFLILCLLVTCRRQRRTTMAVILGRKGSKISNILN